ncbi:flagellar protein FlaG [Halobacillus yeomjeoni]|uniref:flagellar protein FlaG n=1 Tax=Halobacillus yeomjeoni TaxID=311194 RepID=UPI002E211C52
MDIRNTTAQSQLLQRNITPVGEKTSVQEKKPVKTEGREHENSRLTEFDKKVDKEKLKQVADSMNEFLKPTTTALRFQFHDKLEEYYVSIVDEESGEVVREIPPKKMLDLYASIAESLGFIVDHKI